MGKKLLLLALAAWLAVAILSIATGAPMGHDEAAFGVAARGGGASWLYRSAGVIWVAKIGVALGGSTVAMRLASLVLGCGVIVAAWFTGRTLCSEKTGGWAALVIAGAHWMALRSCELLGDLPATACMVAGIGLLGGELSRDSGPRRRVAWVAPLFAFAFYFRYGSAPVIAMAAVAGAVMWPRSLLRAPVLATVALFALLLAPHVIESLDKTGSIFGILEASSKMPRRAYVGEGLVTYVTSNPFYFYGGLVAPLIVVGLGSLARPTRKKLYLGGIAVGQILAIGLQSHAQPRYIFVATTLLVVLGVDVIANVAWQRWLARAGVALVGLAWLVVLVAVVPYNTWLATERGALLASSETIERDGTGPCVFACRVVTQVMWYTGCESVLLRDISRMPRLTGPRQYVVSIPHGVIDVAPVAAVQGAVPVELPTGHPRAHVWRLSR